MQSHTGWPRKKPLNRGRPKKIPPGKFQGVFFWAFKFNPPKKNRKKIAGPEKNPLKILEGGEIIA